MTSFDALREPRAPGGDTDSYLSPGSARAYNILWVLVLLLATGLYLASWWLPAFHTEGGGQAMGRYVLAFGWFGVLELQFGWCANPVFLFGWLAFCLRRYHWGVISGAMAFVLGLHSFWARAWWYNEAQSTPIVGLGAAFYVWMGSFVVLFIGSAILVFSMDPRRYA